MMQKLLLFGYLIGFHGLFAADPYPRNPSIDIQNYVFQIELTDRDDVITGQATISILFKAPITQFSLDLAGKNSEGKGMIVSKVTQSGRALKFKHENDRLAVELSAASQPGAIQTITVSYSGIPQDGLIISKNKYDDRTFFGDNWPDRARHWLPTIDHPYDKATCDFVITAPEHYQVVANGEQVEESSLTANRKLTHWKESVPISTKLMVIGVAQFAVQKSGEINNVPVSTWVFPQNRPEGFSDFAIAPQVLRYFVSTIGPFAYEKLANVQSKTRYGGMENASCIFYFENSVTGQNERESLIAHEVAHQWFGDSATEADWHHVWLSEGFATYFTSLYLEHTYGTERLKEEMQGQRTQVIDYYKKNPSPVIDTTIFQITKVLNTNSYQKGGWVLHMLREEMGDSLFWKGIREYYNRYKNANALTGDFRKIMEGTSGKNWSTFFNQWLRAPGHPALTGNWSYNEKTKSVEVIVDQTQSMPFTFPLQLEFSSPEGERWLAKMEVTSAHQKASIPITFKPALLVLDPNVKLLFEGNLRPR
jgi:aminopeptidase N